MAKTSPFLDPGLRTTPNTLAIAVLSRDSLQPVILEQSSGAVDGYAEGATLNTRFGSFPHSTLLDVPWGSQVRASAVDTGSRGRKRRRELAEDDTPTPSQDDEDQAPDGAPAKKAVAALSGFIHILRPTPELWTSSLPHRTQVVYTPDYSYILHRIRARPGTRLIEAGAGSGSFTHASARAVYSGCPSKAAEKKGKVFSFEFNEPRYQKMKQEISSHYLDNVVEITHRNVYKDGFLVNGETPEATAVFLDLPAPWEALRHLSRRNTRQGVKSENDSEWKSPLDPKQTVHICSFSPCIEQVTRTAAELRTQGWTDVDMVELCNRRLNVIRERVGVNLPNEKGYNASPADVAEALTRLKEINYKTQVFNKTQLTKNDSQPAATDMDVDAEEPVGDQPARNGNDAVANEVEEEEGASWMKGRLVHRTESEIKTHTSYLVFATLPPEWDEEAEAIALKKWPCGQQTLRTIGNLDKEARKQEKRETLFVKKKQRRKYDAKQMGIPP